MNYTVHINKIKINAFMASLFAIQKINNYNTKH